jgi:hypothetical protein
MPTKYCVGEEMKRNEKDGAYSTYGAEERYIQGFGGETAGKETTWKI